MRLQINSRKRERAWESESDRLCQKENKADAQPGKTTYIHTLPHYCTQTGVWDSEEGGRLDPKHSSFWVYTDIQSNSQSKHRTVTPFYAWLFQQTLNNWKLSHVSACWSDGMAGRCVPLMSFSMGTTLVQQREMMREHLHREQEVGSTDSTSYTSCHRTLTQWNHLYLNMTFKWEKGSVFLSGFHRVSMCICTGS